MIEFKTPVYLHYEVDNSKIKKIYQNNIKT